MTKFLMNKYSIKLRAYFLTTAIGGFCSTFDNMASKGFRAISYQITRKVEAGYKPSHTSETLIGYIVC